MTAPQVIATVVFLTSVGSAMALALMAGASSALDAVTQTLDRMRPDETRDRTRRRPDTPTASIPADGAADPVGAATGSPDASPAL
ncbi:hypothetical protein [Methylobacterium sp. 1973]|uniref:hypothetical protein n=1 Tax=Methylobacterium sp. 1973 TaxID=3156421 RepID=UPI003391BC17